VNIVVMVKCYMSICRNQQSKI